MASPPAQSSQIYDVPPSSEDEERAPFINNATTNSIDPISNRTGSLTVGEVIKSKDESISRPLKALVAIMLFQQFSGINAVMFYSVTYALDTPSLYLQLLAFLTFSISSRILTAVNPASAKKTALFVTIINLVMTFPAVYLIDKLGRRSLLLISLAAMSLSSIVLGYSINNDLYLVASIGILMFVVSFASGLGPVPFVLLGELPKEEVSKEYQFLPLKPSQRWRLSGRGYQNLLTCTDNLIVPSGQVSYSFDRSREFLANHHVSLKRDFSSLALN